MKNSKKIKISVVSLLPFSYTTFYKARYLFLRISSSHRKLNLGNFLGHFHRNSFNNPKQKQAIFPRRCLAPFPGSIPSLNKIPNQTSWNLIEHRDITRAKINNSLHRNGTGKLQSLPSNIILLLLLLELEHSKRHQLCRTNSLNAMCDGDHHQSARLAELPTCTAGTDSAADNQLQTQQCNQLPRHYTVTKSAFDLTVRGLRHTAHVFRSSSPRLAFAARAVRFLHLSRSRTAPLSI